jgi:hypothetical protein
MIMIIIIIITKVKLSFRSEKLNLCIYKGYNKYHNNA